MSAQQNRQTHILKKKTQSDKFNFSKQNIEIIHLQDSRQMYHQAVVILMNTLESRSAWNKLGNLASSIFRPAVMICSKQSKVNKQVHDLQRANLLTGSSCQSFWR